MGTPQCVLLTAAHGADARAATLSWGSSEEPILGPSCPPCTGHCNPSTHSRVKPGQSHFLLCLPPGRGLAVPNRTLGDLSQIAQLPLSSPRTWDLSPGRARGDNERTLSPRVSLGRASQWGETRLLHQHSAGPSLCQRPRGRAATARAGQVPGVTAWALAGRRWLRRSSHSPPTPRSQRAGEACSASTAPRCLPRARVSCPRSAVT